MRKIFALILFCLCTLLCWGQGSTLPTQYDGNQWWNKEVLSTEGNEFYVTFMKNYGKEIKDKDFYISIYATAHEGANVTVSGKFTPLDGSAPTHWDSTFYVWPDSVNDIIIPHEVGYMEIGGKTSADVQMKGLAVTSDNRIALYSSNSNKSSYDAVTIYPIQALYKEYVIQTYAQDQQATEFAIVSTTDNNVVDIHIKETNYDIFTGQIISQVDKTIRVPLDKGESYLYRTEEGNISLTGTTICATEPIAIFQGGQIASVPAGTSQTSHIYTQAIPTDAWGKKYVITRTHNQPEDLIRITAAEVDTKIYKDNNPNPIATLQPKETYEEIINWNNNPSGAIVYTSSRAVECYLYQTGKESNSVVDAPTYTEMTPIEHSIHRTLFATFKYRYNASNELLLDNYVNVVIPSTSIGSLSLDGVTVPATSFHTIGTLINGKQYAYAQLPLDDGEHLGDHILYSNNEPFIAHVYGFKKSQLGIISYSYSAGRNILHPAHMLINGLHTNKYEICEGDPPVNFTSVINYDYTNIRWEHTLGGIKSGVVPATLINSNGVHATGDSVYNWQYIIPDHTQPNWKDTVYMIVTRQTPVCENFITDTIKAIVQVNDTFMIDENSYKGLDANVCFSRTDSFYVHLKGKTIGYISDPSVPQYYNGELIHLEYNKPYSFVDSLVTNSNCDTCLKCDSIIEQIRILRPVYDTIIYDTICVNHLPYNKIWGTTENGGGEPIYFDLSSAEKKELTRTTKGSVNPKIKNKVIRLKTIYGCDSTIHLQLVVLPVYEIKENITECKDTINPYEWKGHTNSKGRPLAGHKIYQRDEFGVLHRLSSYDMILRSTPGTYIFYDSLKTKGCKFCDDSPGCDSVHILTLSIKDQLKKIENKNLCDDSSFVWNDVLYLGPKYNKAIPAPYQAEGKHQRLLKNTHLEYIVPSQDPGICDSLYIVDVAWCPTHSTTQTFHICEDETYVFKPRAPKNDKKKEYKWTCEVENGVKKVGIYTLKDTVKTINVCDDGGEGCDSIVTHILYVHPVYHDTTFITECQSFINKYSWSAINESEIWDKQKSTRISKTAIPLDKTGDFVYIDSLKTRTCNECRNGVGCDSILVLCLHINPIYDTIEQRSLCETDTIHWRGKVIVGGKAPEELAQGIKTRYWADPQPKPNDSEDKYRRPKTYREIDHTWNGNKYTDAIIRTTKDGCDSIYWLDLTVYPTYEIHDTIHICDNRSATWQGITYAGDKYKGAAKFNYAAGSEWHTKDTIFSSANGCDSVRYLHLMVHPTYDFFEIDSVCQNDSYIWQKHDGHILFDSIQNRDIGTTIPTSEPGWHTFIDRWKTVTCPECRTGGCDSIWRLRLYVKPIIKTTKVHNICPEELPYKYCNTNEPATEAGIYEETISRDVKNGCDSITTHIINVNDIIKVDSFKVICSNQTPYTYEANDTVPVWQNLTLSGDYPYTFRQEGKCDSTVVLHLGNF